MPREGVGNALQRACESFLRSVPARAEGKPYLVSWLRREQSLPAEVGMELAEIVIELLLQPSAPGSAAARREFVERRAESVLLRLESVLARAAGAVASAAARQHRGVAQLIRHDGAARRSAVLQKLRP